MKWASNIDKRRRGQEEGMKVTYLYVARTPSPCDRNGYVTATLHQGPIPRYPVVVVSHEMDLMNDHHRKNRLGYSRGLVVED